MNGPIDGYSKSELRNLRDDAEPDRGTFCQKCGMIVPVFTDLTDEDVRSLRELIANGRTFKAMGIIHHQVECPLRWARIWVNHPYGANAISQRPYATLPLLWLAIAHANRTPMPEVFSHLA